VEWNKMAERLYDLEEKTLKYARKVMEFVQGIQKSLTNNEIARQLVRSAGSVGANYIEANESLSKKDFALRIKICRKEAKESRYWLKLVDCSDQEENIRGNLIQEATELMKIFG
jgi:four helix bundle protein